MSTIEPRTLKGFKDYLPHEQKLRQRIIDTCRQVFELHGFSGLDTPALEYRDVLTQKYGEDEKLMYSFIDRGGREVALRYDLTVPLARVVAQYQNEIKYPFKRYQIGSSWRADNPQKGRYREFIQADADIVGVESLSADAECIAIHYEVFSKLGIEGFKIFVNSREVFDALGQLLGLSSEQMVFIVRIIDKLDKVSLEDATTLLKELHLEPDTLFRIQDYLAIAQSDNQLAALRTFFEGFNPGLAAIAKLEELQGYLSVLGVPLSAYEFNVTLARGLDYYTGTVFEIKVPGSDFGSVGSGGRYDGLVEAFLGKKVPAVGVSVGVDRLWALMTELGMTPAESGPQVIVFNKGNVFLTRCLEVVQELRKEGVAAEYFYDDKDMDKQFKYAENRGIAYGVFIGDEELQSGKVTLRNLVNRDQKLLLLPEVFDVLRS